MMSDSKGSIYDDPDFFIKGCKEFVEGKKLECENLVRLLSQHPESPKPAEDAVVLTDDNLSDTLSRLSDLIDDEAEDAPLLPRSRESPEKKSSRHLRPLGGKSPRKSKSPSPTRKKIQSFLAREYEFLSKMGLKWKKVCKSASPRKKAASLDLHSQTNTAISEILVELEKIEVNLAILDGAIKSLEEILNNTETPSEFKKKRMEFIDSLKNHIFIDYRYNVDRKIKDNKEVAEYIDKCGKTAAEPPPEQPRAQSPSKKLKGHAKSKASPKHASKAGPSTMSDETSPVLSTPKRTKQKSETRPKKKKKVSSKTKSKGSSVKKVVNTASNEEDTVHWLLGSTTSESSDADSKDTVSSRVGESVRDLDLSETEDSKDAMK